MNEPARCGTCTQLRRRIQALESQLHKAEKRANAKVDPWAGSERQREAGRRDAMMAAVAKAAERES